MERCNSQEAEIDIKKIAFRPLRHRRRPYTRRMSSGEESDS